MPIIFKPAVDPHPTCSVPPIRRTLRLPIGTIWECPTCKRRWEMVGDWNGLWSPRD